MSLVQRDTRSSLYFHLSTPGWVVYTAHARIAVAILSRSYYHAEAAAEASLAELAALPGQILRQDGNEVSGTLAQSLARKSMK